MGLKDNDEEKYFLVKHERNYGDSSIPGKNITEKLKMMLCSEKRMVILVVP